MSAHNSLNLAKQGDPKAIALLLNRSLTSKGLRAQVNRKNDCLSILLEGSQLLDRSKLVAFVQRGIEKLEVADVRTLKIFGREKGEKNPAWSQTVSLTFSAPSQSQERQKEAEASKTAETKSVKVANSQRKGAKLDIPVFSIAWTIGMILAVNLFRDSTPGLLSISLAIVGFLAPSVVVLVLQRSRHWRKIRLGIIAAVTAVVVGYCAFYEEPTASVSVSRTTTASQTQREFQQGEWYEGGSLHQASGLEWQTADRRNKLATCADFVSTMWQQKEFKEPIQSQIRSMDDMKVLSQELMSGMDIAMQENPDPVANRQMYANQKVSEMAALLMLSMGWLK